MKINFCKQSLISVLLVVGAGLSLPTSAQSHSNGGHAGGHSASNFHGGGHAPGNSHGGDWHGGGWHGDGGWHRGAPGWWGFGLGLGLGWETGVLAYPDYPVTVYPYSPPAVVIEPTPLPPDSNSTSELPSAPPPSANWYYCDSAKGYYPYVRECPEPWHIVPATPAPAPQ
jgi:hypothetical protein